MKYFNVDVGGKSYRVSAEDEQDAWDKANEAALSETQPSNVPPVVEGNTAQKIAQAVAGGGVAPLVKDAVSAFIPSDMSPEGIAQSGPVRFALGASAPFRGAAEWLPGSAGEYAAETNRRVNEMTAGGGSGGAAAEFAGEMMNPLNLGLMRIPMATGGTGVVGKAAQYLKNVGTNTLFGGLSGGIMPTSSSDIQDKKEQVAAALALSGAGSAVLPPLISGAARGYGFLKDAMTGNLVKTEARDILKDALGDNLPNAQRAFANAKGGMTAAQEAQEYGVNSRNLSALQKIVAAHDKSEYYPALQEAQRAAHEAELAALAGGKTMTAARETQDDMRKILSQRLGPHFEKQYALADVASDNPALIARRNDEIADAAQWQSVNQNHEAIDAELAKRSAAGFKPMRIDAIMRGLDEHISDSAGLPQKRAILGALETEFRKYSKDGIISGEDAHKMRRYAVDEIVAQMTDKSDPTEKAKAVDYALRKLRPLIDAAFEDAGATGWRDVNRLYQKGSHSIAQREMGARAHELFRQKDQSAFKKLAAGNAPEEVEKIFGYGNYNIADQMGQRMGPINRVASALRRDDAIAEGAAQQLGPAQKILDTDMFKFRTPNLMNRYVAIANKMTDVLEGKVNTETINTLALALRSGKNANELLNAIPESERNKVLAEVIKSGYGRQIGLGSGIIGGNAAMEE